MDQVTLGAVLLAVIGGAGGELGTRLWAGLGALVHRSFRHQAPAANIIATPPGGNAELAALEQNPADEQSAAALAGVLIARASTDFEFRQALLSWWDQARTLHTADENVTNIISGGTVQGPVFQGHTFGNISFGAVPVPRSPDQKA